MGIYNYMILFFGKVVDSNPKEEDLTINGVTYLTKELENKYIIYHPDGFFESGNMGYSPEKLSRNISIFEAEEKIDEIIKLIPNEEFSWMIYSSCCCTITSPPSNDTSFEKLSDMSISEEDIKKFKKDLGYQKLNKIYQSINLLPKLPFCQQIVRRDQIVSIKPYIAKFQEKIIKLTKELENYQREADILENSEMTLQEKEDQLEN